MKYRRLCELSFQEAVIDEASRKRTPLTEEEIKEFVQIVREHPGILICDALLLITQKELDKLVADHILEERIESFMPTYYVAGTFEMIYDITKED